MTHDSRIKNGIPLTLLFILAGSIFLRLYRIEAKPVWYDEAVSISHAEKPLSFYLTSPRVNYKPVYFFLLNRWLSSFGDDAFPLRVFSAIWGILSIILVFRIAGMLFGSEAGLLSAFLMGISVFHIFQCQQIRQFSFVAFLATASVYYLNKFRNTGGTFELCLLLAVNILLMHTYPTGFLVVFAEVIFAAICLRGAALSKWLLSCIGLVLSAGLWFYITDKPHMKEMVWWIGRPGLNSLAETFHTLSWGGPRYGLDDFRISFPGPWLMGVLSSIYFVLILLGFHGGRAADKGEGRCGMILLSLWLIVPVFIAYLVSRVNPFSVYAIKHLIIVLPAFCICAAVGLLRFPPRARFMILLSISLLNLVPLSIMYGRYFPSDWKHSAAYVRGSIKEGDAVIISSLSEVVPFMYYFDEEEQALRDMDIYGKITEDNYKNNIFFGPKNSLIIGIKQSGFDDKNISSWKDFEKKVIHSGLLDDKESFWVLLSRWTNPDVAARMVSYLDVHFIRKSARKFQGVTVYHYANKR